MPLGIQKLIVEFTMTTTTVWVSIDSSGYSYQRHLRIETAVWKTAELHINNKESERELCQGWDLSKACSSRLQQLDGLLSLG